MSWWRHPGRILRALILALRLTLRGETPVASPDQARRAALVAWLRTAQQHLASVRQQAQAAGLSEAKQAELRVRVDGRTITMGTILNGTNHHLTEDYPLLLRNLTDQTLTALHATSLNDRYRVEQLSKVVEHVELKSALIRLAEHLGSPPN